MHRMAIIGILSITTLEAAAAQKDCADHLTGAFFFGGGPSDVPSYWRGYGPPERWNTGLHAKLNRCRMEGFFYGRLAGATAFDNPEQLQFSVGLGWRFARRWAVESSIWNLYSLNNRPAFDRAARRPESSINMLWLGLRHDLALHRERIRLRYARGLRGNLPLFSPSAISRPYATSLISGEWSPRRMRRVNVTVGSQFYLADSFARARAVWTGRVRYPIMRGRFIFEAAADYNQNLGNIKAGNSNSHLASFGFSLPFGFTE